MPFDLEKTTHVFDAKSYGGIQKVVADDANDKEQIELIRGHLRKEANAFARGDFRDPTKIHGREMPGIDALSNGYSRIDVEYSPLPDGAQIRYTTTSEPLVEALHAWFEAQLMDHGPHADHG